MAQSSKIKKTFWQHKIWQPPRYIGFKLLALLLALGIWSYITVSQNPLTEGVYSVPIELRNLGEGLAQPESNIQVQVRVQGNSLAIANLVSRDITAYVDLQGMKEGEATAEVRVELPDNVALVSLSPDNVTLKLEAEQSAEFDIEIELSGSPASSYTLLTPMLNPSVVTLSGSEGRIEAVARVLVRADVSGFSESYSKTQSVTVLDERGADITEYFNISPKTVDVLVPIAYEQPEAYFTVRAVTSGQPAEGYQVTRIMVEPSSVRAFGEVSALSSIYYLETEEISIAGLKETTSFSAKVIAVNSVTLEKEYVTVVVQVSPTAQSEFVRSNVQKINLATGLEVTAAEKEFTVTVSGAASDMQNMTQSDVVLQVDCSSINGPGEYVLPVMAVLPSGITLVEISPASITLQVVESSGTP